MLNDHDLAIMALLASAILFGSTLTFAWLWVRARERVLRAQFDHRQPAESSELQALNQSVDAIAIEVERIAEAQRFTTKLLSDRLDGGASVANRPPASAITPH